MAQDDENGSDDRDSLLSFDSCLVWFDVQIQRRPTCSSAPLEPLSVPRFGRVPRKRCTTCLQFLSSLEVTAANFGCCVYGSYGELQSGSTPAAQDLVTSRIDSMGELGRSWPVGWQNLGAWSVSSKGRGPYRRKSQTNGRYTSEAELTMIAKPNSRPELFRRLSILCALRIKSPRIPLEIGRPSPKGGRFCRRNRIVGCDCQMLEHSYARQIGNHRIRPIFRRLTRSRCH